MDKEKELQEVEGLIGALTLGNYIRHILFIRIDGDVCGITPETIAVIKRSLEYYREFLKMETEKWDDSTIN